MEKVGRDKEGVISCPLLTTGLPNGKTRWWLEDGKEFYNLSKDSPKKWPCWEMDSLSLWHKHFRGRVCRSWQKILKSGQRPLKRFTFWKGGERVPSYKLFSSVSAPSEAWGLGSGVRKQAAEGNLRVGAVSVSVHTHWCDLLTCLA